MNEILLCIYSYNHGNAKHSKDHHHFRIDVSKSRDYTSNQRHLRHILDIRVRNLDLRKNFFLSFENYFNLT